MLNNGLSRLKKAAEFNSVYEKGNKFITKNLIFIYIKNQLGYTRLGVVISKKSCSRAVDRNNIKRINKECFSLMQEQVGSKESYDVVVIAKRNILGTDKQIRFSVLIKQWENFVKCS